MKFLVTRSGNVPGGYTPLCQVHTKSMGRPRLGSDRSRPHCRSDLGGQQRRDRPTYRSSCRLHLIGLEWAGSPVEKWGAVSRGGRWCLHSLCPRIGGDETPCTPPKLSSITSWITETLAHSPFSRFTGEGKGAVQWSCPERGKGQAARPLQMPCAQCPFCAPGRAVPLSESILSHLPPCSPKRGGRHTSCFSDIPLSLEGF